MRAAWSGVTRSRRLRNDDGQLLLLILVYTVIAGLLVTVVVDVSQAYLYRRSLLAAADAAAVCAANRPDLGAVYTADGPVVLPLNFDNVVVLSFLLRNTAHFVNTDGILAADGTQAAQFVVNAGELTPLIGFDLAFAYITRSPVTFASNPVLVNVQN